MKNRFLILAAALVAMASFFIWSCGKQTTLPPVEEGGQVHGFVVADLGAQGGPSVRLPNIEVYLKEHSSGKESQRVKTDALGRFVVTDQPVGTYQICVAADGYTRRCQPDYFVLSKETYYPRSEIKIAPIGPTFKGRVLTKDGTPCFHDNPVFHSRLQALATLLDSNEKPVGAPVLANSEGFYLIPRVPADHGLSLSVTCGGSELKAKITGPGVGSLAPFSQLPLEIKNRGPHLISVVATLNGKSIRSAPVGSVVVVRVTATDPDGDVLHYQWTDGTKDFASSDSAVINWTLSSVSATNVLFIEVSDGKGGYASGKITVITGAVPVVRNENPVDFEGREVTIHGIAGNKFLLATSLPAGSSGPPSHSQPWLSFKNTACEKAPGGCNKETLAYYDAIGASSSRDTLKKFQSANGFNLSDNTAIYYNAGDLGLGREMHCRQSGGSDPDVACYVTNYGLPGGDPKTALDSAIAHQAPVATVGMDYSLPPRGTVKVVKFYVWNAAGDLWDRALLDSEGPKSVPQACLVCHGGTYSEATHLVKNASFREFDVFSFVYSTQNGFTRDQQIDKFRTLNEIVKASHPNPNNVNHPIAALIDGIFPSGSGPVGTYVPPGWAQPGKSDLYSKIPRVYCRACHIAQSSSIDWTSYSQVTDFKDTIESMVCSDRTMPHAEVPFRRFWSSTNDPAYFASAQTGLGFSGNCPAN
jgi:hypothetical protein